MERIEPISNERKVEPVTLTRLTPSEREQDRRRREREREQRRKAAPRTPAPPSREGGSGVDIRV